MKLVNVSLGRLLSHVESCVRRAVREVIQDTHTDTHHTGNHTIRRHRRDGRSVSCLRRWEGMNMQERALWLKKMEEGRRRYNRSLSR